ncbi:MAG TPA: hypothetical protein ENH85_12370 [Candidatus Scalindua sp.]|nr:hypothetical protein [Candidatus Scalindua sp.]
MEHCEVCESIADVIPNDSPYPDYIICSYCWDIVCEFLDAQQDAYGKMSMDDAIAGTIPLVRTPTN